jgi:hypothetical protein
MITMCPRGDSCLTYMTPFALAAEFALGSLDKRTAGPAGPKRAG